MSRSKAFQFQPRTDDDAEPFELTINDESFLCHPAIDGLALLEYTSNMRFGNPVAVRAGAMLKWLQTCIIDYQAFEKVVAINRYDVEDLGDVCGYLAEVYSTRPTTPAPSSSTGQTTTGSSSEGTSSSEESIPLG